MHWCNGGFILPLAFLEPEPKMSTETHEAIVSRQFSPQARSYLTSAVHAGGEDLDLMARLVGKRPQVMALDVGCGGGHATFRLSPLVEKVVACDLSEAMLAVVAEEAQRRGLGNVIPKQGAAETLDWPSAAFDVVVSRYSAHHWLDLPAALAQMRRVSKKGGLAIFMDATSPPSPLLDTWLQTLELLRDPSHVRDYSVTEWRAMLAAAGFTPGAVSPYRLRLDFSSWISRMNTPDAHVQAIRSLQQRAGADVSAHFAIETDGSFTIDTMLLPAEAA